MVLNSSVTAVILSWSPRRRFNLVLSFFWSTNRLFQELSVHCSSKKTLKSSPFTVRKVTGEPEHDSGPGPGLLWSRHVQAERQMKTNAWVVRIWYGHLRGYCRPADEQGWHQTDSQHVCVRERETDIERDRESSVCVVWPNGMAFKPKRCDEYVDEDGEKDKDCGNVVHPVEFCVFPHIVQIILYCWHREREKHNKVSLMMREKKSGWSGGSA